MPSDKPLTQQLKTAKTLIPSPEGSQIYTGRVNAENTTRYYKLRLGRASDLSLSLHRLKADANLELLNRKGKVIDRSAQEGRAAETIRTSVKQGLYYVRVSQHRGSTRYRLSLVVNPPAAPATQTSNSFIQAVLDLTNLQRRQAGLQPLRLNDKLAVAAQFHSTDMARNDFFSHTGSNGSSVFDRVTSAGYNYALAAENIAAGYATPHAVVKAWMNSPGHRANILYPGLREIGIGFYFMDIDPGTTTYRYYWTQNFGTPGR
ncbi:CAP domain-containing protein [Thermocoleostomius sinensis]|uniref:CAP domain-containing protein n=1 Tax=Thermocoleostomius sinensis A174 TaxID=2016057 RepID=A0A9E9C7Y0_9CYAN|nr:CAP domain-containing protein [Thermocoleostomius sinensis]WAL59718.1 CAP domain-containing protein [Thermocoleostomius sinensis A174]